MKKKMNSIVRPHSPMDPDQRKLLVADAVKELYAKESTASPHEDAPITEHAKTEHQRMWNLVVQTLRADHLKGGVFDEPACFQLIMKLHMDAFVKWSKDDVLRLLCYICTEAMTAKAADYALHL